MPIRYQSDQPLTAAQERLKIETAWCNHADLPPISAVRVLAAISRYAADEASAGKWDDASVLAALKFIRDWSGDTYGELAEMMGRPSKTPQKLDGGAGEALRSLSGFRLCFGRSLLGHGVSPCFACRRTLRWVPH